MILKDILKRAKETLCSRLTNERQKSNPQTEKDQGQEVYLPAPSCIESVKGTSVESFYIAGFGSFGFNYVHAYYVKASDIGLDFDVLVLTPNRLGANEAGVGKVVNVERYDKYVKMVCSGVRNGILDYVLAKLYVPKHDHT